jgi:hypothetical protein
MDNGVQSYLIENYGNKAIHFDWVCDIKLFSFLRF